LSINNDFEHAAAGRDELQRGDAMLQLEQFVRQTDGMRLVVSSGAILDGNIQSHDSNVEGTLRKQFGSVKAAVGSVQKREKVMQ
jgi:hypothetical protein